MITRRIQLAIQTPIKNFDRSPHCGRVRKYRVIFVDRASIDFDVLQFTSRRKSPP